jgi:hypothetical protein
MSAKFPEAIRPARTWAQEKDEPRMTVGKSILDAAFTYVPADRTDLQATFARVRAEFDQKTKGNK